MLLESFFKISLIMHRLGDQTICIRYSLKILSAKSLACLKVYPDTIVL